MVDFIMIVCGKN